MSDTDFVLFRQKSNGAVVSYPAHYIDHPVIGPDLEPYDPEDNTYEEDKVVSDDHNLPVDQRGTLVATEPVLDALPDELTADTKDVI